MARAACAARHDPNLSLHFANSNYSFGVVLSILQLGHPTHSARHPSDINDADGSHADEKVIVRAKH
jgi:hypothetical protein